MAMSELLPKEDCKMMEYPKSILSAVDSLVNLLALPDIDKEKKMKGFSGRKCFALWEKSNQNGYWAKMSQDSCQLLMFPGSKGEHSEPYSTTWPHWGIVSGGLATELVRSGHRTKGKGHSSWPTPRANDAEKRGEIANDVRNGLPAAVKHWPTPQVRDYRSGDNPNSPRQSRKAEQGWSQNLNDAVKLWGTPTASSCKGSSLYGSERHKEVKRGNLRGEVMEPSNKGQLNPDWVECLMGFSIGWTDIDCDDVKEWVGWPAPLKSGRDWMTPTASQCGKTSKTSGRPIEMSTRIQTQVHVFNDATGQYSYEPPRVISGQKNRAKRLKCIGNAVMPQQIYPIFKYIASIEKRWRAEVEKNDEV